MPQPIRLLLLEDNVADVELITRALQRDGFEPSIRHVDNQAGFMAALAESYDAILSDFELPQFDGLRALEAVRERGLTAPFLIVSGTIGEETAVEAMKRGASDYLLKDRLFRLGPAIRQALRQRELGAQREHAERALRSSEEQFREVVENIHEVLWVTDVAKTRVLYVSPSYETVWGRSCESLLTAPWRWLDSVHPEDRRRVTEASQTQAGGRYDETYRVLRPDASVRWIRDRAYPVRDEAGEVVRIVGVAEDITERKHLEAQFLRAQRLEAIGTLAGGMAHDLNNILAPMMMAAGLLKEGATVARDREMLAMIERSAHRGASIIRQLLTFSRGIEGERRSVQPRHIGREIANIVRETFPREIIFVESLPLDLWPILADPTQFHQVLMNLCVNARDAMPKGGTLTLSARNVTLTAAEATTKPRARPISYVVFSVVDTGTGMPSELIEHIFEPFFTTKEVGKGTGLGLSTVQGIMRSHEGLVEVASEVGLGSTFNVYFPAAPGIAVPVESNATAPSPDGEGETILLVDDEAPVRSAIQRVLEKHRYRVLTASNGKDGIVAYLRHRDAVRLVITDVMMPQMGGSAMVRSLRVIDANLRFIAISGLDAQHEELTAVGVKTILDKPCGSGTLLEAVRAELARA